jgi:hypothetical protein
VTATAATSDKKSQSWRPLIWGLAAFLFLPVLPPFDVLLPVQQTLILIVPALAVCSLLGWRAGGPAALAIIWVAASIWILFQFAGPPLSAYKDLTSFPALFWIMLQPLGVSGTAYNVMAPAWAVLMAASFGVITLLATAAPFFTRALGAVALSLGIAFGLALSSPSGIARFQHADGEELMRRAGVSAAALARGSEQVSAMGGSGLSAIYDEAAQTEQEIAGYAPKLVAALLALESLIALGLAWTLYHRLAPVRIGPRLGRLAEFRFNDQLIWGLAVGLTLALLPAFGDGRNAGYNLLTFFGAIYTLRGLGLLGWIVKERYLFLFLPTIIPWGGIALITTALSLGVTDTWLDLRNRAKVET